VWLGLIKGGLCWIVAILIGKDEKKSKNCLNGGNVLIEKCGI